MLTVRNKHMAHLCMPSLHEVPLLISVISQLKYWCKETVFFFFLYTEGGLTFSGLSVRRRSVLRLWQISSVDPTFVLVCQPAGVSVSFFCFCSDLYLSLSLSTLSQPDSFSLLFIFCSFKDALFRTAAEISALHYFLLDNLLNKIRTRV